MTGTSPPLGHAGRKTALASLLCALLFALFALAVLSGRTSLWDMRVLLLTRSGANQLPIGPGWLTQSLQSTTHLGDAMVRHALTAVAVLALGARRRWPLALWLACTVLAAPLLNSGLKLLFARPRPDLVPQFADWTNYSFPSGHAFNGMVLWLAMALALSSVATTGRRFAWLAGALLLVLTIGFSRVWLGVHWPSDVIGGWLGGLAWTLMAWSLWLRWDRQ